MESDGKSNTAGQSSVADDQIAKEKLERARKNKEKALELRKSRNRAHPYSKPSSSSSVAVGNPVSHVRTPNTSGSAPSLRDSHAGYIIEDEPTKHAPVYRVVEESGECGPLHSILQYHSVLEVSLGVRNLKALLQYPKCSQGTAKCLRVSKLSHRH